MSLKDNLRELAALRQTFGVGLERIDFGDRVRQARKNRGMTLDDLAGATGIAKSYLSQIETGYAPPPRDDKIRRIADALGMDGDALVAEAHMAQLPDDVKERMARMRSIFDTTESVIRKLLAEAGGTEGGREGGRAVDLDALHASGLLHHLAEWGDAKAPPATQKVRPVPVINRVAAGYPQEFTDLGYPVGVADEYVAGPAELVDPHAFALRVIGDSMVPRYREGDVVIFSPAAAVESGADCFVRFAVEAARGGGESTFKRVFFDAEDQVRLQPLNERYAPTVVAPSDIEGIFRAVARYERL